MLRKIFFVSSRVWDTEKFRVPMRNRTSDLQTAHTNALPLSHRDSTVSEVYYKVPTTCILHTAGISNIDSVMFVDGNKRDCCYSP